MLYTAWSNIIKLEEEFQDLYYFLANTDSVLDFWTNLIKGEWCSKVITTSYTFSWSMEMGVLGWVVPQLVRAVHQTNLYARAFVAWNLSRKYQLVYTCNMLMKLAEKYLLPLKEFQIKRLGQNQTDSWVETFSKASCNVYNWHVQVIWKSEQTSDTILQSDNMSGKVNDIQTLIKWSSKFNLHVLIQSHVFSWQCCS